MRSAHPTRQRTGLIMSESKGFTIIELMIATMVFSVILIIITTGIIRITQTYYKGINLVNTQNTARSIMDSISQSIQLSGGTVAWPQTVHGGGTGCIGNQSYDFQLGTKLVNSADPGDKDWQGTYSLALDPNVANCAISSDPVAPATGATELLGPHMRLTRLNVGRVSAADSTDNLYSVAVTVVYGDYDLLCDTSLPSGDAGGCNADAPAIDATQTATFHSFLTSPHLTCRSGSGSEYCAVSALSTIVQQRMTVNQ